MKVSTGTIALSLKALMEKKTNGANRKITPMKRKTSFPNLDLEWFQHTKRNLF